MLKILVRNSRYAPVLVCDVCNQLISDAKEAAVVFPNRTRDGSFLSNGEFLDVMFVHKGVCHDTAEVALGGSAITGWNELLHHFVFLLNNIAIGDEELRLAVKAAAMIQELG